MSNAVTRTRSMTRYNYHHPQHHQLIHKQLQSPESDESTFCSNSLTVNSSYLTNLDRIIQSVTPTVTAYSFTQAKLGGWRPPQADVRPFFSLGDLWESFKEWSVYGVGVPLLLSGNDTVKQYYVPSLSGVQLYVEPNGFRRYSDKSDCDSSREMSSAASSDRKAEKRDKGCVDGVWGKHNIINLNSQGFQRLSLREQSLPSSSSDISSSSSRGSLVYEYLEQEQPHHRKPLYDKVSTLASKFPEIKTYRSCDLLPESWVSVAWYPIYRIPTGPTLQNLDASFLTFHSLSTHPSGKNLVQFDMLNGRKTYGMVASPKITLPVLGLASYKLRGSILTPGGTHEWQQASSLFQAANNWLGSLEVEKLRVTMSS